MTPRARAVGTGLVTAAFVVGGCSRTRDPARGAPLVVQLEAPPTKAFQLLGDEDRQYAPPRPVVSATASRYGILGADLGVPVKLGEETLFLFADVVGVDPAITSRFLDVVAFGTIAHDEPPVLDVYPPRPGDGLGFLPLAIDGTSLGRNDGPSSAFAVEGDLYAFFDVGFLHDAIDPTTGRAAGRETGFLTVSHDRGRSFHALFDLPASMVWTQNAVVDTSDLSPAPPPWSDPQSLLVWGHSGDGVPVLSAAPLGAAGADGWRARWVWWTAREGASPRWSIDSAPATPVLAESSSDEVLHASCGGNFGVARLPGLGIWLMMERCNHTDEPGPTFIAYRTASSPLGPWSARRRFFDPLRDGATCVFVHAACEREAGTCCDADTTRGLGGAGVAGFGDSTPGRVYAPFVLPGLAEGDADPRRSQVRFLLSTFNPYTVIAMKATLSSTP